MPWVVCIVRKGAELAEQKPGYVEITCCTATAFKDWSKSQFARAMTTIAAGGRRVEAGTMAKVALNEIESALGFRYNPHGLIADPALFDLMSPPQVLTYDWVHSMLHGGALSSEVEALLAETGVERCRLQEFLADASWTVPACAKARFKGLARIFDAKRGGASEGRVKASCSEMLGVYGLLRFFFELELEGRAEFAPHLLSLRAICEVIDLLLAAKQRLAGIDEAADRLDEAVGRHLASHLAAYGSDHIRPKHHWLWDVVSQIRRDRLLLDAFVVERIHLRIKGLAEKIRKTTSFESSVLASTLASHLTMLETAGSFGGLLGRTAPFPGLLGARIADKMEAAGVQYSVGDVVLLGDYVGVVAACATEGGELWAVVSQLQSVADVTSTSSRYRDAGVRVVWQALSLTLALAWRVDRDGAMLVLRR